MAANVDVNVNANANANANVNANANANANTNTNVHRVQARMRAVQMATQILQDSPSDLDVRQHAVSCTIIKNSLRSAGMKFSGRCHTCGKAIIPKRFRFLDWS